MADAAPVFRNYWLIFAGLGLLAMFGLMAYNRMFSNSTPEANRLAHRIMVGLYAALLFLGLVFAYTSTIGAEITSYKTLVQAVIMLLLGFGGLWISLRHPAAERAEG